jgi:hypothetical protein
MDPLERGEDSLSEILGVAAAGAEPLEAPPPAPRPTLTSSPSSMLHPIRRGAARVNVIWLVFALVLFMGALGILIATSSDLAKSQELLVEAQAAKQAAEDLHAAERGLVRQISEVAGWYDREQASARTNPEAFQAGLGQFKDAFPPDMGVDVKSFEDALGRAIAAHRQLQGMLATQEQLVAQLTAESAQKSGAMEELTKSKDSQIADLRTQLQDAQQAASKRENDLTSEVASVRTTLGDTETELTQSESEKLAAERAYRDERTRYETRLKEMSSKLSWVREPERPDGRILAVSNDLNLAWIDLGKRNRLFAGMGFTVVTGTPGNLKVKAHAVVLDVGEDMAQVTFTSKSDPFDPPVAGDVVYNPLYDPIGERNAVLVGRFSGTYNEPELKALLSEIGVNVQDKLDKTTDYLIVGSEIYVDEEGEPLEEPMQPSELAAYKEAEAMGVQIVPLKLVRDYFRRTQI